MGPALFCIGCGLAGLCPGPPFTALGTGQTGAIMLAAAMLVGMAVARAFGPSDPAKQK